MRFMTTQNDCAKFDFRTIGIPVVSITEDDIVINKRDLAAELRGALMEVKENLNHQVRRR